MHQSATAPFTRINWPKNLNEQIFLDRYWQKQPLLIRQALPDFISPLCPDELAGLSLEPDTTARLITCDEQGQYHSTPGPFDEELFDKLTDNRWSLLVTDVEKTLPDLRQWLVPFGFLPQWRIDDLMISYAPDGASVGAHIDEYDVFLLQATGTRTWAIDRSDQQRHAPTQSGDLKILIDFQPSDTWDLHPGDLLYLPPGLAHHGIAKGDHCTTWSIGFRAPLHADLMTSVAQKIAESEPEGRYSDGPLTISAPGQISEAAIRRFRDQWEKRVAISDHEFAGIIGQWLTESDTLHDHHEEDPVLHDDSILVQASFSRLSWIEPVNPTKGKADTIRLFADGTELECSRDLAIRLCSSAVTPIACSSLGDAERITIQQLLTMGVLYDSRND